MFFKKGRKANSDCKIWKEILYMGSRILGSFTENTNMKPMIKKEVNISSSYCEILYANTRVAKLWSICLQYSTL